MEIEKKTIFVCCFAIVIQTSWGSTYTDFKSIFHTPNSKYDEYEILERSNFQADPHQQGKQGKYGKGESPQAVANAQVLLHMKDREHHPHHHQPMHIYSSGPQYVNLNGGMRSHPGYFPLPPIPRTPPRPRSSSSRKPLINPLDFYNVKPNYAHYHSGYETYLFPMHCFDPHFAQRPYYQPLNEEIIPSNEYVDDRTIPDLIEVEDYEPEEEIEPKKTGYTVGVDSGENTFPQFPFPEDDEQDQDLGEIYETTPNEDNENQEQTTPLSIESKEEETPETLQTTSTTEDPCKSDDIIETTTPYEGKKHSQTSTLPEPSEEDDKETTTPAYNETTPQNNEEEDKKETTTPADNETTPQNNEEDNKDEQLATPSVELTTTQLSIEQTTPLDNQTPTTTEFTEEDNNQNIESSTPHEETTTSYEESETTTPFAEIETTTPYAEIETTTPYSEIITTTPYEDDNTSNPDLTTLYDEDATTTISYEDEESLNVEQTTPYDEEDNETTTSDDEDHETTTPEAEDDYTNYETATPCEEDDLDDLCYDCDYNESLPTYEDDDEAPFYPQDDRNEEVEQSSAYSVEINVPMEEITEEFTFNSQETTEEIIEDTTIIPLPDSYKLSVPDVPIEDEDEGNLPTEPYEEVCEGCEEVDKNIPTEPNIGDDLPTEDWNAGEFKALHLTQHQSEQYHNKVGKSHQSSISSKELSQIMSSEAYNSEQPLEIINNLKVATANDTQLSLINSNNNPSTHPKSEEHIKLLSNSNQHHVSDDEIFRPEPILKQKPKQLVTTQKPIKTVPTNKIALSQKSMLTTSTKPSHGLKVIKQSEQKVPTLKKSKEIPLNSKIFRHSLSSSASVINTKRHRHHLPLQNKSFSKIKSAQNRKDVKIGKVPKSLISSKDSKHHNLPYRKVTSALNNPSKSSSGSGKIKTPLELFHQSTPVYQNIEDSSQTLSEDGKENIVLSVNESPNIRLASNSSNTSCSNHTSCGNTDIDQHSIKHNNQQSIPHYTQLFDSLKRSPQYDSLQGISPSQSTSTSYVAPELYSSSLTTTEPSFLEEQNTITYRDVINNTDLFREVLLNDKKNMIRSGKIDSTESTTISNPLAFEQGSETTISLCDIIKSNPENKRNKTASEWYSCKEKETSHELSKNFETHTAQNNGDEIQTNLHAYDGITNIPFHSRTSAPNNCENTDESLGSSDSCYFSLESLESTEVIPETSMELYDSTISIEKGNDIQMNDTLVIKRKKSNKSDTSYSLEDKRLNITEGTSLFKESAKSQSKPLTEKISLKNQSLITEPSPTETTTITVPSIKNIKNTNSRKKGTQANYLPLDHSAKIKSLNATKSSLSSENYQETTMNTDRKRYILREKIIPTTMAELLLQLQELVTDINSTAPTEYYTTENNFPLLHSTVESPMKAHFDIALFLSVKSSCPKHYPVTPVDKQLSNDKISKDLFYDSVTTPIVRKTNSPYLLGKETDFKLKPDSTLTIIPYESTTEPKTRITTFHPSNTKLELSETYETLSTKSYDALPNVVSGYINRKESSSLYQTDKTSNLESKTKIDENCLLQPTTRFGELDDNEKKLQLEPIVDFFDTEDSILDYDYLTTRDIYEETKPILQVASSIKGDTSFKSETEVRPQSSKVVRSNLYLSKTTFPVIVHRRTENFVSPTKKMIKNTKHMSFRNNLPKKSLVSTMNPISSATLKYPEIRPFSYQSSSHSQSSEFIPPDSLESYDMPSITKQLEYEAKKSLVQDISTAPSNIYSSSILGSPGPNKLVKANSLILNSSKNPLPHRNKTLNSSKSYRSPSSSTSFTSQPTYSELSLLEQNTSRGKRLKHPSLLFNNTSSDSLRSYQPPFYLLRSFKPSMRGNHKDSPKNYVLDDECEEDSYDLQPVGIIQIQNNNVKGKHPVSLVVNHPGGVIQIQSNSQGRKPAEFDKQKPKNKPDHQKLNNKNRPSSIIQIQSNSQKHGQPGIIQIQTNKQKRGHPGRVTQIQTNKQLPANIPKSQVKPKILNPPKIKIHEKVLSKTVHPSKVTQIQTNKQGASPKPKDQGTKKALNPQLNNQKDGYKVPVVQSQDKKKQSTRPRNNPTKQNPTAPTRTNKQKHGYSLPNNNKPKNSNNKPNDNKEKPHQPNSITQSNIQNDNSLLHVNGDVKVLSSSRPQVRNHQPKNTLLNVLANVHVGGSPTSSEELIPKHNSGAPAASSTKQTRQNPEKYKHAHEKEKPKLSGKGFNEPKAKQNSTTGAINKPAYHPNTNHTKPINKPKVVNKRITGLKKHVGPITQPGVKPINNGQNKTRSIHRPTIMLYTGNSAKPYTLIYPDSQDQIPQNKDAFNKITRVQQNIETAANNDTPNKPTKTSNADSEEKQLYLLPADSLMIPSTVNKAYMENPRKSPVLQASINKDKFNNNKHDGSEDEPIGEYSITPLEDSSNYEHARSRVPTSPILESLVDLDSDEDPYEHIPDGYMKPKILESMESEEPVSFYSPQKSNIQPTTPILPPPKLCHACKKHLRKSKNHRAGYSALCDKCKENILNYHKMLKTSSEEFDSEEPKHTFSSDVDDLNKFNSAESWVKLEHLRQALSNPQDVPNEDHSGINVNYPEESESVVYPQPPFVYINPDNLFSKENNVYRNYHRPGYNPSIVYRPNYPVLMQRNGRPCTNCAPYVGELNYLPPMIRHLQRE